jgi:hypothetical protein
MFPNYYILLDRLPVAVDLMTWAHACEDRFYAEPDPWRVGDTEIGNVRVSTVFLSIDHNFFRGGDPILFETHIFGGPLNGEGKRYSTYQEAERGHAEYVTKARIAAAKIKAIADHAGAKA